MDSEQIKDPEKCKDCLKSLMLQEDKIDLFIDTYKYLKSICSESTLREASKLLVDETVYAYRLAVTRKEEGLNRGRFN